MINPSCWKLQWGLLTRSQSKNLTQFTALFLFFKKMLSVYSGISCFEYTELTDTNALPLNDMAEHSCVSIPQNNCLTVLFKMEPHSFCAGNIMNEKVR